MHVSSTSSALGVDASSTKIILQTPSLVNNSRQQTCETARYYYRGRHRDSAKVVDKPAPCHRSLKFLSSLNSSWKGLRLLPLLSLVLFDLDLIVHNVENQSRRSSHTVWITGHDRKTSRSGSISNGLWKHRREPKFSGAQPCRQRHGHQDIPLAGVE